MMHRVKFMYKQFLSEPLWFKALVVSMLLITIVFSNSAFSELYQGAAKAAAAIFFIAYGVKFRRSPRFSVIFFLLAVVSLYLSVTHFIQAA